MYDYPELCAATDVWAAAIARFAGVDEKLTREDDYAAAWHRSDLAFSQTCGYPFTHQFRSALSLVGTPHYAVRGCDGFRYSSFVFGRKSSDAAQYRGAVASINTADSMSGMLALRAFFNRQAKAGIFFKNAVISGSHLNSLALLQRGEADVCAIDAVCVDYVKRFRPELLVGLVELGQTPLVPGLPYVTRDANVGRWQMAVAEAVADPALADVRQALRIGGFTTTRPADYDVILQLEDSL